MENLMNCVIAAEQNALVLRDTSRNHGGDDVSRFADDHQPHRQHDESGNRFGKSTSTENCSE
jgi:hypothetical protein